METALKELEKLEKLASNEPSTSKGKTPAIQDSLNSLLQTLHVQKKRLEAGIAAEAELTTLPRTVEARKKEIDERQKEIYNSLARYGKALDKRFTTPLPTYEPLFASKDAQSALEHVIAMHFLRTGRFSTAETFMQVYMPSHAVRETPHQTCLGVRASVDFCGRQSLFVVRWVERNRDFLQSHSSALEFYLHRSEYLQQSKAIEYANRYLQPFFATHPAEVKRLMGCLIFLPKERMQNSPYEDLTSETIYLDLENMFATGFCASLGMSKQPPLRVVGILAVEIEIPLPAENRYHSIFACPVSKDQSTEQNPPMMMNCGHVVSKDSLQKLSKTSGRVKCPYCPVESMVADALRVHF
ncbi:RING-type zinc-finger-domain-containing protein [Russula brevipes]|nr:RING-type zinc-finger-domain-containing protein [Russula brevipes]